MGQIQTNVEKETGRVTNQTELSDPEKIVKVLESYRRETGTHITIEELVAKHNWELLQVESQIIGIVSISIITSVRRGDTAFIDLMYILKPFRPDDIMAKIWIELLSLLQEKGFTRYEVQLPGTLSIQFKRLSDTVPKEYRYWGRAPFVIQKIKEWQSANPTGG